MTALRALADPGVDHTDVNGAQTGNTGPIGERVGRGADVVGRDIVGYVNDPNSRAAVRRAPLHGTDIAIRRAKIGQ